MISVRPIYNWMGFSSIENLPMGLAHVDGPVHRHPCSCDLFWRARDVVGLGKPVASLYRKR